MIGNPLLTPKPETETYVVKEVIQYADRPPVPDLSHLYKYHKPDETAELHHSVVRQGIQEVHEEVERILIYDSAEKRKGVEALREAMMWFNAAIALGRY